MFYQHLEFFFKCAGTLLLHRLEEEIISRRCEIGQNRRTGTHKMFVAVGIVYSATSWPNFRFTPHERLEKGKKCTQTHLFVHNEMGMDNSEYCK